jgi:predicted ATP-binding protein involved in virulence
VTAPNRLLRLQRLKLRNFRSFAECDISFHEHLTVLVAENGQGKTSILDALRKALLIFTQTVSKSSLAASLDEADIRLDENGEPQLPTRFDLSLLLLGQEIDVGREIRNFRRRPRNSKAELAAFITQCETLQGAALGFSEQTLPVAAFYGTGRLYDQHRLTRDKRFVAAESPYRVGAYLDSLSPSASYKVFASWYESQMDSLKDPAYKVDQGMVRPERLLATVEQAVRVVLQPTGWTEIGWDPAQAIGSGRRAVHRPGRVRLKNEQAGWLPLEYLSDGIQNMVALVADLAHKCVRLNPHFGPEAALQTPGVVLIDEVDMHLHPQWQQLVVELLQKAFPQVQFILTTHSPHVLSTVDSRSIRVISVKRGLAIVEEPKTQTRGDESAAILARVMDVDPVPDVEPAQWLSSYRALVQQGRDQTSEAWTKWEQLVSHFGADHPLLQEAAILRRLQEFKRQNNIR